MTSGDHGLLAAAPHGIARSSAWRKVSREFKAKHPHCAACDPQKKIDVVQAHHIFPFHYCVALGRPDLELDERNLITLCWEEDGDYNHHLILGHLDDFHSSNLEIMVSAKQFSGKKAADLLADLAWKVLHEKRLPKLGDMTEKAKADFTKRMNSTFPIK